MFGNMLLGLCCANGPPHGGRLRLRWTTASVVLSVGVSAIGAAHADPSHRASEWIAGAGPPDVLGAGPSGFFVSGRRFVICGRIEFQR